MMMRMFMMLNVFQDPCERCNIGHDEKVMQGSWNQHGHSNDENDHAFNAYYAITICLVLWCMMSNVSFAY